MPPLPRKENMDLQVVWPKGWLADDFERAGLTVSRHTGFEPVEQAGPIWWTTEDASRSIGAGHAVNLTAPNFEDFVYLGGLLLQRKVWAVPAAAAASFVGLQAFVKPADSKFVGTGNIGRATVANVSGWVDDCMNAGMSPKTVLLISDVRHFSEEWRFWTDGETVLDWSVYARDGETWDEWDAGTPEAHVASIAKAAVAKLGQPCCIDVGLTRNNTAVVVELNPVWSSGLYSAHPDRVFKALRAATEKRGRPWVPDANLKQTYGLS